MTQEQIETKTYSDGTVATGPAPLPAQSPASETGPTPRESERSSPAPTAPANDRPASYEVSEAEVLGLAEDYGQWMWDCGYMDSPTGEKLVDEAAFKRLEIRKALEAALLNAYAEGRKDEREGGCVMTQEQSNLQPHQQRVVAEKAELDERLTKLRGFIQSPLFAGLPKAERDLLMEQEEYMHAYSEVLDRRIVLWGDK